MKSLKKAYEKAPAVFSTLLCVALAVISIGVYALVGALPIKARSYDITPQGVFTLSEQTGKLLKDMDGEVEILLVTDSGIPNMSIVDKLLQRYASYSDKLKITPVYPDEVPRQYGTMLAGSVIVKSDKRETAVYSSDYFDVSEEFFNLSYNYYYYATQQGYELGTYTQFMNSGYAESLGLFDIAKYELVLTTAIDYVLKDDITTVYAVTGHGETGLEAYMYPELRQNYTEIISGTLDNGIPENADGILILDPTSDITEQEYRLLSEYQRSGGKLALVTSYSNAGNLTLLKKLCEEYGLSTDGGFICEDEKDYNMNGYPQIIRPTVNTDALEGYLPDFTGQPVFSGGTGITVTEKQGISTVTFLSTSENAYSKTDAENAESPDFNQATDVRGKYGLGVIATDSASGGELMWITSFSLNNSDYDVVASGSNYPVFTAALSALFDSDKAPDISPMSIISDSIEAPEGAFAAAITLSIAIPCIIMLAYGLIAYSRRRVKKAEENEA
ncbi:MAG: Gldg family protein [Clostridia bacterium]|nr:Gldg family protein [Clostridia bacterium]